MKEEDRPEHNRSLRQRARTWIATLLAHALLLVLAFWVLPSLPDSNPGRGLAISREQELTPLTPRLNPSAHRQMRVEESAQLPEDPHPELGAADELIAASDRLPAPIRDGTRNYVLGLGGGMRGVQQGRIAPPRGYGGAPGFAHRRGGGVGGGVGGGKYAEVVHRGLDWLADHQDAGGYWDPVDFHEDSRRKEARFTYNIEFYKVGAPKGDSGMDDSVHGVTGLALLAFTSYGYDHRTGPDRYRRAIRAGMRWVLKGQANDGAFCELSQPGTYGHLICTQAICELYGLSGDPKLSTPATMGVYKVLEMQNPGLGWRYGCKPRMNDSSVTGWAVLTLKTSEMAGIGTMNGRAREDALNWFDSVTVEVNGYPKSGYDSPGSNSSALVYIETDEQPVMDAVNVMARYFLKEKQRSVHHQAERIIANPPKWEPVKMNYYYWYYAALALYQCGGSQWARWESAMVPVLANHQRGMHPKDKGETAATLDEYGSWDAIDAWSPRGGRVYATAINCMTMAVWERYEREESGNDQQQPLPGSIFD